MFVDEKAMGEPYQPEKPYRLPRRFIIAMLAPIPLMSFSFSIGISYSAVGQIETARQWMGLGEISIAFILATIVVALLRSHKNRIEREGPS